MTTLRDYQREAIAAILADWAEVDRTLAVLATGTGKTIIFLALLDELRRAGALGRALIVAHRRELIQQPLERARAFFPELGRDMGVVMASADEAAARHVVATVQTLASDRRLVRLLEHGAFSHLVVDECFPAGTLVDGRPIETITVGDVVTAWDESAHTFVPGRVARTFRRPAPRRMVRITFGAREIICTSEHPIWANDAWTPAAQLKPGDCLVVKGAEYGAPRSDLCHLREAVLSKQRPMGSLAQGWQDDVLADVYAGATSPCFIRDNGSHEPALRQRTHAAQQSDGAAGEPREDAGQTQGARLRSWPTRREWRADDAADRSGDGARLADRVVNSNGLHGQRSVGLPGTLQGRHRGFGTEDRDRGGWQVAQAASAPRGGRQENNLARVSRVDRVEVLELGRGRRSPGVCSDGFVYNLEVERYHTYIANGLVVHNCHHSTSETYQRLVERVGAAKVLGVTATPLRTDGDGLARVFQRVSYRLPISAAIRRGALVPFNALGVSLPVSLAGIRETEDGWASEPMGNLLAAENVLEIVHDHWRQYAADRRTIIFTASVAQARATAEFFAAKGAAAAWVSGETPKRERGQILADYQAGRVQVVANCMVLTEGFDAPETAAVLMVAPTKSDLIYVQRLGRGLRTAEGKADCLVLDFAPLEDRNVVMAGDVLGKPREVKQAEARAERAGVLVALQVDRLGEAATIDPGQLIVRVLNLLRQDALSWTVDGLYATAALSEADTLCLALPDPARLARAEALRRAGDWNDRYQRRYQFLAACRLYRVNGRARLVGHYQTVDEAKGAADDLALDLRAGEHVLAKKRASWRREPSTPAQRRMLAKLGVAVPEGATKGAAAQLITHHLAVSRVKEVEQ